VVAAPVGVVGAPGRPGHARSAAGRKVNH